MIRTLSRAMAVTAITASALFSGMTPALAQGNWSWTDISDKIAERQNRPVWAMAYASPYWYLTDGQELWSGGHVWKTEGSVMSDITTEVRNAGLSRVDDIVSDGQTVLFLKNVTSRNNTFEILSYDGSFSNRTGMIRNYFAYDEGIASVHGKNGQWAIVSTKGRVMIGSFNGSFTTAVQTSQVSLWSTDSGYSMTHDTATPGVGFIPVSAVPMGSSWFIAYRETGSSSMRFVKFTYPATTENITVLPSNFNGLQFLTSNGTNVIVAGNRQVMGLPNTIVYTYDGYTAREVTNSAASVFTDSQFFHGALIASNGNSWMFLRGKSLYRFDGTNFESLGKTRDLFLTVAGNGSGTFLLGGAESNEYVGNNPSYPLTLKLAKAQESYVANNNTNTNTNTTNAGGTYTSANGPTLTVSGSPSNFTIVNGDMFNYSISATDPNGVNRMEIYTNGAKIKTCTSTYCDFSAQYFTNGLTTRAVPFYAIAVDNQGNATQSPTQNLTVNLTGTTTNTSNNTNTAANTAVTGNGGVQMWTWLEPSQTSIRRDQNIAYHVAAYDTDGIKRIEIILNGNVAKTCDLGRAYGNQECVLNIYGGNYNTGTTVSFNAKIIEGTDQISWTQLQNLSVTDVNSTQNTNTNTTGDMTVASWFEPSATTINRSGSTTLRTQASAAQGLSRIDIYVNGSILRTCELSRAYGTQNCDYTLNGSNYPNGSQVSMNARATDANGKLAWSNLTSIMIQENAPTNTNTNPSTNSNTSVWVSSDPEKTDVMTNETVRFVVGANDVDGIRRIDVFVNGSVGRTCDLGYSITGNYNCSYVIYGNSYSAGSVFYVNARITDGNGNMTWSDAKTYTIKSIGSTSTQTTNSNGSSWVWSDPNVSEIKTNETVRFNVGSYDPQGIRRIELIVNGSTAQSCDLGYAQSGTVQCSVVIHGSNYPAGSSVFVNAKITDGSGNVSWSDPKTYMIKSVDTGTTAPTTPTNGAGSVSITSNHDNGYANNETISFAAVASDVDGVAKIEILVNGDLVKTCTNVNSCGYTGGPYNDRNSVTYAAKMTDTKGNAVYQGYKTIYKR